MNIAERNDNYWMRLALIEASKAERLGEVPVGAIVVLNGKLVSSAGNRREKWNSPLGHAELLALSRASKKLDRWRLSDCELYVTLEPCPMCAGAMNQARIGRLVFGAFDPKMGAMGTAFPALPNYPKEMQTGVLTEECSKILTEFFKRRRK